MSDHQPPSVQLLCLDGDGIGPEITQATIHIITAAAARCGFDVDIRHADIGLTALQQSGTTFPDNVLEMARSCDGIILGPVSHNDYPPVAEGGINPSGSLRKQLDLYANIRPAKSFEGVATPCGIPVDLIVVRENTEGFYADRSMSLGPGEFMPTDDLALSVRKVTRDASLRIARSAFELAAQRRSKVTAVHKANVLRVSDGLFLECVRNVGAEFPNIEYEEQLVDAMAALLIRDAGAFDVIVTTNMFGDILSDEASELAGGLGLAASLNAGEKFAVAQAQHGSAPSLAGQNKANPCSLIGSAAMLLRWIGVRRSEPCFGQAAQMIDDVMADMVSQPETRTPDLNGTCGTDVFADIFAKRLSGKS